jgi:hypothetical protein
MIARVHRLPARVRSDPAMSLGSVCMPEKLLDRAALPRPLKYSRTICPRPSTRSLFNQAYSGSYLAGVQRTIVTTINISSYCIFVDIGLCADNSFTNSLRRLIRRPPSAAFGACPAGRERPDDGVG